MLNRLILWKLNKMLESYKYSIKSLEYDTSIRKVEEREWVTIKKSLDDLENKKKSLQEVIGMLKTELYKGCYKS